MTIIISINYLTSLRGQKMGCYKSCLFDVTVSNYYYISLTLGSNSLLFPEYSIGNCLKHKLQSQAICGARNTIVSDVVALRLVKLRGLRLMTRL